MSWVPMSHRVLVEIEEVERKFENSVIHRISDTQEKEQQAQVIATVLDIGPSAEVDERLQVGNRVMIAKWGGATPPGENPRLRVVNDDDICAMEVNDV